MTEPQAGSVILAGSPSRIIWRGRWPKTQLVQWHERRYCKSPTFVANLYTKTFADRLMQAIARWQVQFNGNANGGASVPVQIGVNFPDGEHTGLQAWFRRDQWIAAR